MKKLQISTVEHFKGTKANDRGHGGGNCLCCLHEVSGLHNATNIRLWQDVFTASLTEYNAQHP